MIKHYIISKLATVLAPEIPEAVSLFLEKPKHMDHGDYALPVAFQLARAFKKAPKLIAEELCHRLSSHEQLQQEFEFFPLNGFINIKVTSLFLKKFFSEKQVSYVPTGKKHICLEYVSANPTGPLHIGHGRWAVLGSVLGNVLSFVGHSVHHEFYINDAGNQVDKFYESVNAVKQGNSIPEDGYHGAYVHELAQIDKDPLNAQLEHQQHTLSSLRVGFDTWFSEKSLHQSGKVSEALELLSRLGWSYEKDGATWFRSSDLGDEKDRVLIKADGKLTYFAVDVAYHFDKLNRNFDQLINIWGADHHGYVARVKAAVHALRKDVNIDETLVIIIGQLVSLLRDGEPVRMSKRTGDMISLEEVIEEIGPDALRYFLISKSSDTHVEFDLELAKKQSSENPVYYIQYAHARMCTLFGKVNPLFQEDINWNTLEDAERSLLVHLLQFYDEIEYAASTYSPYKVAQYTYDLAKLIHSFYEACPVLKADNDVKEKRLFLLKQAQEYLVKCLNLLGISAPESM